MKTFYTLMEFIRIYNLVTKLHGDRQYKFDLYHNLYSSHYISIQPQDNIISVDYLPRFYALVVGKNIPMRAYVHSLLSRVLSLVSSDFRTHEYPHTFGVMVYVHNFALHEK